MHGTVWENLERTSSSSEYLTIKSQSSVKRPVEGTKRECKQASRRPPAIGHIRVTSCESSSPSSPCQAQEQGNSEHRPQGGHGFSCTFCQPENHGHSTSEWETLSEGWFFLKENKKPTAHFIYYILCDCVQFADTLMMVSMYGYLVFGFLKTAWNEMYNSQSYLCFCNFRDKSTLLCHPLTYNLVFCTLTHLSSFNLLISSHTSMPRFSMDKRHHINYATGLAVIHWGQ